MKVLLTTAADHTWSHELRAGVERAARMDRFGEHSLTDNADEADLILFVDLHQHPRDWRQSAIRGHDFVRRFPEKVFVYDERDTPRDSLPGVFVAMPRSSFDERRHRAFGYYFLVNDTRCVADCEPDLLFSFQGRRVGAVRNDVLALSHQRAIIEDTSQHDFFTFRIADRLALAGVERRYREVIGRSKFVLCPRGAGATSIRLFETLAAGRVPVVLSDEWVPPQGVDWQSCSVRIPERDVDTVARRLESLERDWPLMSRAARSAYDDWFSPEVWFHRAVEHCRELTELRSMGLRRQWAHHVFWHDGMRHWKADAVDVVRWTRSRSKADMESDE